MPYSVYYTDTEWEKERKEVQGRDQSDFGYQTGGGKWMKDKHLLNIADVAESMIRGIEVALEEHT